jgi:hypothetical protein
MENYNSIKKVEINLKYKFIYKISSLISQENCGRLYGEYPPNLQHQNADDQT